MPYRKGIKKNRLPMPRPFSSFERKAQWVEAENKRLEADGSKWRYGFSSADPSCISLLGAEGYRGDGDLLALRETTVRATTRTESHHNREGSPQA